MFWVLELDIFFFFCKLLSDKFDTAISESKIKRLKLFKAKDDEVKI